MLALIILLRDWKRRSDLMVIDLTDEKHCICIHSHFIIRRFVIVRGVKKSEKKKSIPNPSGEDETR